MMFEVLTAAGVGVLSALVPLLNAEAFLTWSSLTQGRSVIVACVIALALGQTGGKLVIFTASRRGATLWRCSHSERPPRAPAWICRTNARLLGWLSHPKGGPAAIVVSATLGLPPLLVVSATAGASRIRCSAFSIACFAGRLVRFACLAGGLAALTT